MAHTGTPGVIRVKVIVEHDGAETDTDIVEIPRGEWNAMTPDQRTAWCIEQAEDFRGNICASGFNVLDGYDVDTPAD